MDQCIKLLQYADDTLGISEDESSARHFLLVVKEFGLISGLTLNMTKTEAMWIGSDRHRTDKPLQIVWSDQPMKILGVYFGYNTDLSNERNFEDKISKVNKIINMWKQRDLSLIGRIQIIKTFIISQFLYSISAINIPEKYIKEI